MNPTKLHFEQWVPFPVEKVFLFFANPENLPRIMPPAAGTRLLKLKLVPPPDAPPNSPPLAGVGSEIVTSFRIFPFLFSPFLFARAEWIAEITEFQWNHHFADEQRRGPFQSFHHRHELTPEIRDGNAGTLVRDVITYNVGFGALGQFADKLFVRRQLEKTFAYRQRALQQLLP